MRYLIGLLFLVNTAHAAFSDVDKAFLTSKNILSNPGFELGKLGWTASGGTFSVVTSGSNLLEGGVGVTWDSGSASQTLLSTAVAIPKGLYTKNGQAYCTVQTPSGTATHKIQAYDGTNVLAEANVVSSSSPVKQSVNFIFPSSGNISLRIISVAADEPLIAVDDCYVGEATNLLNVSQATFVGSAFFARTTNCSFTRANTALGVFADTDCPGPTVVTNPGPGVIQTTDANAPNVTVNSLPPGTYRVVFSGVGIPSASAAWDLAINDGTDTNGKTSGRGVTTTFSVEAVFTYTSTANRTFSLYGSSTSGSLDIQNDSGNQGAYFHIYRFPSSPELAATLSTLASSWSGYHDNTCSWARTNTSMGDFTDDGSCALVETQNQNFGAVSTSGSVSPAITFTPKRAGKYFVCAGGRVQGSSLGANMDVRLTDGTTAIAGQQQSASVATSRMNFTICGVQTAASTSPITIKLQGSSSAGSATVDAANSSRATIEGSIFQIDQQIPMPVIVNSVYQGGPIAMKMGTARLVCTSPPTETNDPSNMIASQTFNGTGDCTHTFTSGYFVEIYTCHVQSFDPTVASND
jgi:hypothetical protein